MNEEPEVIAIDPGHTCGFSIGYGRPRRDRVTAGQLSWREMLLVLENEELDYKRVVIENFHTRMNTPDAERTLKVIGAIEWIAFRHSAVVAFVEPSAKLKYQTEVRDIPGDHARSAEAVRLWDFDYGKW